MKNISVPTKRGVLLNGALIGGGTETALAEDIAFTRELGIRTLPSYMIQYGENMVIVRSLIDHENFVSIIEQLRKQEGNL